MAQGECPHDRSSSTSCSTDDYQLWAHGFAVIATLYHCRHALEALLDASEATLEQLCVRTRANSGHLAVMLRTLSTLGWVSRSADGAYSTTACVARCASSATLARLCEDVYGESVGSSSRSTGEAWGSHLPRLARWLESKIGRAHV